MSFAYDKIVVCTSVFNFSLVVRFVYVTTCFSVVFGTVVLVISVEVARGETLLQPVTTSAIYPKYHRKPCVNPIVTTLLCLSITT